VEEYSSGDNALARGPSMLKGPYSDLLPPAEATGRYTVVLDLDETVIYARDGPLEVRPHFDAFLAALDGCCEVIVWTAGRRDYAKAVIRNIDRRNVIAHCVYRHEKWFRPSDYTKDLTMLGRPLDKVLIVENTPDCVRNNPNNGIIVRDFEGGGGGGVCDDTLQPLATLVQTLCGGGRSVPEFLADSPLVVRQRFPVEGGELEMYVLKGAEGKVVKSNPDLQPPLSTRPPAAKPKAKAVKPKAQAAKLRAKVAKPKAKVARPKATPRNPKAAPAKPRAAAAVVKGGRKAKEQAKKEAPARTTRSSQRTPRTPPRQRQR